ncbi:hypothetical protein [Pantoea sp. Acro-807]|uniref:hypothetical protein n=1 Tax=Pantoea sp. Acro-807 TaxID=2608356 RepID=UPI00141A056E|nr:hypothetical protein [Pantoea sp. Acro-807]NIE72686.1 hypothetical protein [Pantoea sp. Acro-807]
MAIISTQKKNKYQRNYCSRLLLIASFVTTFTGTPAISIAAQSEHKFPSAGRVADSPMVWSNPVTHNTFVVDPVWILTTKVDLDRVTTTFENKATKEAIGFSTDYLPVNLETYIEDIKKTDAFSDIQTSGYEDLRGIKTWRAFGTVSTNPRYKYVVSLHKAGDTMFKVIGSFDGAAGSSNAFFELYASILLSSIE